ncbi:MAG: single-stranded DNA-binding protein [Lactobacillales bacterium]|jgi:single-strand DNA-binding protein|nr:single-stranded DNA-binding protein [Lactobacillales bacterium]
MAGSINKVILVGNLGRDPEIRNTNSGQKIAHLSVATSDTWKDKSGERQERTEWHRVVVFNSNLVDFVERFCKKGSKMYVEGALQTRKYTDSTGVEKYTTEIILGSYRGELVLLDSRSSSDSSSNDVSSGGGWDNSSSSGTTESFDDEIPF